MNALCHLQLHNLPVVPFHQATLAGVNTPSAAIWLAAAGLCSGRTHWRQVQTIPYQCCSIQKLTKGVVRFLAFSRITTIVNLNNHWRHPLSPWHMLLYCFINQVCIFFIWVEKMASIMLSSRMNAVCGVSSQYAFTQYFIQHSSAFDSYYRSVIFFKNFPRNALD